MEQKIEDIRSDILEIKTEQKRQGEYIDTQKAGIRVVSAIIVTVGSVAIFFKEHLVAFFFGKVTP